MIKKFSIFAGIIFLAVFLRLYNLSNVPPSVSLDEVSIGYNAYSILKTGADEYGNKFPLLLRAYDDWRPALYVYLVIPFVKFFGLNAFAVRMPSVILSVATIIATYFLVKELFGERGKTQNKTQNYADNLALFTSFLLTISPWHIYISRLGHEANAGFAFGLFAIFFFLKFINNPKGTYLYVSAILFGLSFYSYQSEKVFVPLIIVALSFIFFQKLIQRKKQVFLAAFLGLIIVVPVLIATFSPNGLIRFKATSAFNINDESYTNAAKDRLIAKQRGDILREIINNNRFVTIKIFLSNYLSHFNPYWLFTNNANEDFKAPEVGLMYRWEFPFIILGIIYLFFTKKLDKKIKLLISSWILISPIAASITTASPHAMRVYNLLPIPQILAALGLLQTTFFLRNILNSKYILLYRAIIFVFFLIVVANASYFYKQYFYIFPKEQSDSFQYALSKSISFVLEYDKSYGKIVFSNQDNLYQSYMFFLFYSKYDPKFYQKLEATKSGGFAETHSFGKYEFRPIKWDKELKDQNILYVGNSEDFPENVGAIKTVDYLNGELGIKIIKGN